MPRKTYQTNKKDIICLDFYRVIFTGTKGCVKSPLFLDVT